VSPADARLLALAADAERDWQLVAQNLDRARSVSPAAGAAEAALVALALAHAYAAFETMIIRIERASGLPERAGAVWHRTLLADAARPIAGLRPELVPPAAEQAWAELLSFRHFLHHAYAVGLDAGRLERLVTRLEQAVAATDPTVIEVLRGLRDG
jgi:hypothetical protein